MNQTEALELIEFEDEPKFRSVEIAAMVMRALGALTVLAGVISIVGGASGDEPEIAIGGLGIVAGGVLTFAGGGVLDVLLSIEYHVRRQSLRTPDRQP